jgi:hypothetical protein
MPLSPCVAPTANDPGERLLPPVAVRRATTTRLTADDMRSLGAAQSRWAAPLRPMRLSKIPSRATKECRRLSVPRTGARWRLTDAKQQSVLTESERVS